MKKTSLIIQVLLFIIPWKIRRYFLCKFLGYKIDESARIGFSLILSKQLTMLPLSRVGNFSICNSIDSLYLGENSRIGSFIYITGYPSVENAYFSHVDNRECVLHIGRHSAITSRHFIDCTAGIIIGSYTTVAGIRSQLLTHSIDITLNRQDASRIEIGSYCFIGTDCVVLPGAKLPDYSVLGAKSLLNKKLLDSDWLYGGVPAKPIKRLIRGETAYFNRNIGVVK